MTSFMHFTDPCGLVAIVAIGLPCVYACKKFELEKKKNARDGLQLRHEYAVAGADVDAAAEHVGCELG